MSQLTSPPCIEGESRDRAAKGDGIVSPGCPSSVRVGRRGLSRAGCWTEGLFSQGIDSRPDRRSVRVARDATGGTMAGRSVCKAATKDLCHRSPVAAIMSGVPSKPRPEDVFIEAFLSAYDDLSWADADKDWVDRRVDGGV